MSGIVRADRMRRTTAGNIFAAATQLANKHGSVNLGQGFPSFPTPDFVRKLAQESIEEGNNQYARPAGHPFLVETLSEFYGDAFGKKLEPMTEISVCSGGQEGIYNVLAAFCNEGDEIMCIEPYFDSYKKAADLLGVVTKGVPLRLEPGGKTAASYKLDVSNLDEAISEKTKVLILNTPHNPTGKVFSREEYEQIAHVVRKHSHVLVLSDEVYEFMTFDGLKHERFSTIEGMWNRTISLFSAGKTFSCTGWRIGYCVGPAQLIAPLIDITGVVSFCAATPLQVAIGKAFKQAMKTSYFSKDLPEMLAAKRDALCKALDGTGMTPIIPQGGYFVMADTSFISDEELASIDSSLSRDMRVYQWLTLNRGITGIPTSNFYSPENQHLSFNVLRFAFCKTEEEIQKAAQNLLRHN